MEDYSEILNKNAFNVPFTLGEFVNRLADKFQSNPLQIYTDKEVMYLVEEIILQMCNKTEQELIKGKAIEFLIAYLKISKN